MKCPFAEAKQIQANTVHPRMVDVPMTPAVFQGSCADCSSPVGRELFEYDFAALMKRLICPLICHSAWQAFSQFILHLFRSVLVRRQKVQARHRRGDASLRAGARQSRKGEEPRPRQAKLPCQRLAAPVQNHGEALRSTRVAGASEPPLEDDRGWALDACGSVRIPRPADRRPVLPGQ